MKEMGIETMRRTLQAAASACERAQRWDLLKRLVDELKSPGSGGADHTQQLRRWEYECEINQLILSKQAEEAFRKTLEMKQLGFVTNRHLSSVLMAILAREGNAVAVMQLFKLLKEENYHPSYYDYRLLIKLYPPLACCVVVGVVPTLTSTNIR